MNQGDNSYVIRKKCLFRDVSIQKIEEELEEYLVQSHMKSRGPVETVLEELKKMKIQYSPDYKIFEDSYYWSSFICIQNMF